MDPKDAQWWTTVVTFVLTEIDNLRKSGKPVLLLGATNHYSRLDAAIVRPGRIEKRISVLPPNETERRAMFAACLGDAAFGEGLSVLARLSPMATPAAIESWCKSAIASAHSEGRALELRDLVDLISPAGERSEQKDRAVAIHEAGHAIVGLDLGLAVSEISIIGVGAVGGWVNTSFDDRLMTRHEVECLAAVMLAGRAADTILGGGAHAGAASDLADLNALLRSAMVDFGLYGSLATASNVDLRDWRGAGISLWSDISNEIDRLYDKSAEIVSRRRDDVLRLVEVLLRERVVTGERLEAIVSTGLWQDRETSA